MDNYESIYELSKHSENVNKFDKYEFYSIHIALYDLVLVSLN